VIRKEDYGDTKRKIQEGPESKKPSVRLMRKEGFFLVDKVIEPLAQRS